MINEESTQAEALEPYYQTELHTEDLEEHNALGLPHAHPHMFAKALLGQLARLPLLELDRDQEHFSEHTVALSA